jgi:hypothetical protein
VHAARVTLTYVTLDIPAASLSRAIREQITNRGPGGSISHLIVVLSLTDGIHISTIPSKFDPTLGGSITVMRRPVE